MANATSPEAEKLTRIELKLTEQEVAALDEILAETGLPGVGTRTSVAGALFRLGLANRKPQGR